MSKKKKKILDWNSFNRGVFLVNALGVIFDSSRRKILIGKRKKDPYIEKLGWSFPGGRPNYGEDLEKSFEKHIKRKTGLKVKSLGPVFSRLFKENDHFLLIYYLCEVISGKEKPSGNFVEFKWVKPEELESYFTTSFDERLKEYIMNLR